MEKKPSALVSSLRCKFAGESILSTAPSSPDNIFNIFNESHHVCGVGFQSEHCAQLHGSALGKPDVSKQGCSTRIAAVGSDFTLNIPRDDGREETNSEASNSRCCKYLSKCRGHKEKGGRGRGWVDVGSWWKGLRVLVCCSCRSQRQKVEDKARNFGAFSYPSKEFTSIFLPVSFLGTRRSLSPGGKKNHCVWFNRGVKAKIHDTGKRMAP